MRPLPSIRGALLALAVIGLVGGMHGRRADALDVVASFTIPQMPAVVDLNGPAAGSGYAATFVRNGGGPVAIADPAQSTVVDPVQADVASATVTITDLKDGAESLAADVTGTAIVATYDPIVGRLTLAGVDTVAHYQQVLRTLTYDDTTLIPDTTDRLITVVVNDGSLDSVPATSVVSLVIDRPPVAQDRTIWTVADLAVVDHLPASDIDGDPLTWQLVTAPASGTATLTDPATGAVSYAPNPGFSGTDSFTFRVYDGFLWSPPATATVVVTPRLATARPQVVSSPPREAFVGDTVSYLLYADTSTLPAGTDLVFRQADASTGVTVTKTGPTTATITWTSSALPGTHQEIGILIIDPATGTSAFQPIQVLWLAVGGGNG